jgi:hypothetical protein
MKTAVVMPCGPGDDWQDTLNSIRRYTTDARIYLIDDGAGVADVDATVIRAERGVTGSRGGLWTNLARAYLVALSDGFDVLVRIDADAVMLGHGLADVAASRFALDPQLGLLGSYRIGPDGTLRDFAPARRAIERQAGWRGGRRAGRHALLRELLRSAYANGYVLGEHPLGGAYIHRYETVAEIATRGWLATDVFRDSSISEDHLMGLMTVAAGFRIGDFGGPDDPMALRWIGLPASPAELLATGKLVTHSVRQYGDTVEAEIRRQFAAHRHA